MRQTQPPIVSANTEVCTRRLVDAQSRSLLHRLLLALIALALLALLVSPTTAWAHPSHPRVMESALDEDAIPQGAVRPRPGITIKIPRTDDPKLRVHGRVVWFTVEQVGYIDAKEEIQVHANWSELEPKRLAPFLSSLPDRRDVDSLLTVAEIMIVQQIEAKRIEHLFKSALRVDKNASERIDALREKLKGAGEADPEDAPDAGEDKPGKEPDERGADGQPDIDNPRAWPKMSDDEHAAAVEALQGFVDPVLEKMSHKMGSTQTERFLVYSDMPKKESKYWVGVLDKMYDKLCETFDLDKEENIWNGKCLLLFFNNQEDYLKYNAAAYGNNASGSAGICYQFPKGDVHIAMYKQRDEKVLAHVLVHEAVHGFLFRYQSSHYVPNWLNEGLAEYIAVSLVKSGEYPRRAESSRQLVKSRGRLDNFLSARNIQGPHYGLAYDVTAMMVDENRKGYVKLIQGIKEGKELDDVFNEDYGASIDRVFAYYAKTRLKLDKLKMN